MLTDGKTTFNVGYDRCYCHVIYIHRCCWQMLFANRYDGSNAFVTDVIVTFVTVADGTTFLEIINQFYCDRW